MDAYASIAVQAFRERERVQLLLDKKDAALSAAVRLMAVKSDKKSRDEYVIDTAAILEEYALKRGDL